MSTDTATKITPSPFRFDGHGVNDAEGQRICKVSSCDPYIYPDGSPIRNAEFDRLSNLFAAAPDLLAELKHALADAEGRLYMLPIDGRGVSEQKDILSAQIGRYRAAIRKADGK